MILKMNVNRDRNLKDLFDHYIDEAYKQTFSGWDFSYLTASKRMHEKPLKWNYFNIVKPFLLKASCMLDMGTGGGEVLSTLSPLPPEVFATESYKPNIRIAKKKLESLGVTVIGLEEEKEPPFNSNLPFEDEHFDLIINRHEGYYPKELKRILKVNGIFITQQVGSISVLNLLQFLNQKTTSVANWNLKSAINELESYDFRIIASGEDVAFIRFYDIGAIVYYLKAIPWLIEDFNVKSYKEELWDIHLRIAKEGYFDVLYHRFYLVSEKI